MNKENGGDYKTFTQYKGSLLENNDENGFKFLKSSAIAHPPYDVYTEFGRFEITTNTKNLNGRFCKKEFMLQGNYT